MANLKMSDLTLIGISHFRIKTLTVEIKKMKANMQIEFKNLVINGTYKLSSVWARSAGHLQLQTFMKVFKNIFIFII